MIDLPKLNFPTTFDFKLQKQNSKIYIFDQIRRKYILLTPEEFVRQNLISYFIEFQNKSKSAFILEKKIEVNNTTKRVDILIMNKDSVEILIECKAPNIKIDKTTFEQIARYNTIIKAKYLLLSNGLNHFMFIKNESGEYENVEFLIGAD